MWFWRIHTKCLSFLDIYDLLNPNLNDASAYMWSVLRFEWKKKCFYHVSKLLNIFFPFSMRIDCFVILTLKWPRYFYSRWCQGGGGLGPNRWKPLSQSNFAMKFAPCICMDYNKSQFWKCCIVSKWRSNNRFLFRVFSILVKIWKTTFPKEFFNEIWLKVLEHKYIYITEIHVKKNYFILNDGQNNLLILRNNANLC